MAGILTDKPEGFTLGEYWHRNHDNWPGFAETGSWRQGWVKLAGSDTAHVHPIDHRGDWNGLFKILPVKAIRLPAAESQHDLGFTHCHDCGFEIFDCECPEQLDLEELTQ